MTRYASAKVANTTRKKSIPSAQIIRGCVDMLMQNTETTPQDRAFLRQLLNRISTSRTIPLLFLGIRSLLARTSVEIHGHLYVRPITLAGSSSTKKYRRRTSA